MLNIKMLEHLFFTEKRIEKSEKTIIFVKKVNKTL